MRVIEYHLKEVDFSSSDVLAKLSGSHLILENLVQKGYVDQVLLKPTKFLEFVIGLKRVLISLKPNNSLEDGVINKVNKGWNNYFSINSSIENISNIMLEHHYEKVEEISLAEFLANNQKRVGESLELFSTFLKICRQSSPSELGLAFGHDLESVILIKN